MRVRSAGLRSLKEEGSSTPFLEEVGSPYFLSPSQFYHDSLFQATMFSSVLYLGFDTCLILDLVSRIVLRNLIRLGKLGGKIENKEIIQCSNRTYIRCHSAFCLSKCNCCV